MTFRQLLFALVFVLLSAGLAHADVNAYIRSLNVVAEGDIGGFRTRLGAHFGTSGTTLDLVLSSGASPGEAAVLLWLGQRSNTPMETVLQTYQSQKGQGWGAIAKSLGIKPGSADFHALKEGRLGWYPDSEGGSSKGKGKGRK
jgi:hypothetical protein